MGVPAPIISLADLSEKEVDCNIFSIFESDVRFESLALYYYHSSNPNIGTQCLETRMDLINSLFRQE